MYDVLAVDMNTNKVLVIAENKTERNANAIEAFAVMQRGCDKEFFVTTPSGRYKDGDEWGGNEDV